MNVVSVTDRSAHAHRLEAGGTQLLTARRWRTADKINTTNDK